MSSSYYTYDSSTTYQLVSNTVGEDFSDRFMEALETVVAMTDNMPHISISYYAEPPSMKTEYAINGGFLRLYTENHRSTFTFILEISIIPLVGIDVDDTSSLEKLLDTYLAKVDKVLKIYQLDFLPVQMNRNWSYKYC